jgi:hypothetical protein
VLQDYFVKIGLQQQQADINKYSDNSFIQKAADALGPRLDYLSMRSLYDAVQKAL